MGNNMYKLPKLAEPASWPTCPLSYSEYKQSHDVSLKKGPQDYFGILRISTVEKSSETYSDSETVSSRGSIYCDELLFETCSSNDDAESSQCTAYTYDFENNVHIEHISKHDSSGTSAPFYERTERTEREQQDLPASCKTIDKPASTLSTMRIAATVLHFLCKHTPNRHDSSSWKKSLRRMLDPRPTSKPMSCRCHGPTLNYAADVPTGRICSSSAYSRVKIVVLDTGICHKLVTDCFFSRLSVLRDICPSNLIRNVTVVGKETTFTLGISSDFRKLINLDGLPLLNPSIHYAAYIATPYLSRTFLIKLGRIGAHAKDLRDGTTPLHQAIEHGNTGLAKLLLRYGASVDLIDHEHHWTPLYLAAFNKQLSIVKLLLDAGASPTIFDRTTKLGPLHLAAIHGWVNVSTRMMAKGASIGIKENKYLPNRILQWLNRLSLLFEPRTLPNIHYCPQGSDAQSTTLSSFCATSAPHGESENEATGRGKSSLKRRKNGGDEREDDDDGRKRRRPKKVKQNPPIDKRLKNRVRCPYDVHPHRGDREPCGEVFDDDARLKSHLLEKHLLDTCPGCGAKLRCKNVTLTKEAHLEHNCTRVTPHQQDIFWDLLEGFAFEQVRGLRERLIGKDLIEKFKEFWKILFLNDDHLPDQQLWHLLPHQFLFPVILTAASGQSRDIDDRSLMINHIGSGIQGGERTHALPDPSIPSSVTFNHGHDMMTPGFGTTYHDSGLTPNNYGDVTNLWTDPVDGFARDLTDVVPGGLEFQLAVVDRARALLLERGAFSEAQDTSHSRSQSLQRLQFRTAALDTANSLPASVGRYTDPNSRIRSFQNNNNRDLPEPALNSDQHGTLQTYRMSSTDSINSPPWANYQNQQRNTADRDELSSLTLAWLPRGPMLSPSLQNTDQLSSGGWDEVESNIDSLVFHSEPITEPTTADTAGPDIRNSLDGHIKNLGLSHHSGCSDIEEPQQTRQT